MKKCPLDKRIKCDKMDCKTCEVFKRLIRPLNEYKEEGEKDDRH
jgi:hypothetical protein